MRDGRPMPRGRRRRARLHTATGFSGLASSALVRRTPRSGGGVTGPVARYNELFASLACNTCHLHGSQGRGPVLTNLFGNKVELQGGAVAVADEAYLRESIMNPQAKIVAGFLPVMPTFQGLVTEEQLLQLIAYVRSLSQQGAAPAPAGTSAPTMPQNSTQLQNKR